MISIVKSWGFEYLLEVNPEYTLKKIVVRGGEQLPRHYHQFKRETFYILEGSGSMLVDTRVYPMCAGSVITIDPGERHELIPSGVNGIVFLEASTTYLTDSIREAR